MSTSSTTVASPQRKSKKSVKLVGVPFAHKKSMTIIGTYHSVMAGLILRNSKFLLKLSVKHHTGCINCVAICEKFIATAGTDERLFLFTVKDKGAHCADLGSLAPPSEVRRLSFPNKHFLVCGCTDGSLLVYRTRDWEVAFNLPIHSDKGIEAMGFHPLGGKVAVTVGNDRFMAILDMMQGRIVTKHKVPPGPVPHHVCFNSSGTLFFLVQSYRIICYDTLTSLMVCKIDVHEQQPENEIHGVCVLGEGTLLIGHENGMLRSVYISKDIYGKYQETTLHAHEEKEKPSLLSLCKDPIEEPKDKHDERTHTHSSEDEDSDSQPDDDDDDGQDSDDEENDDSDNEQVGQKRVRGEDFGNNTHERKSIIKKKNISFVPADSGSKRHINDDEGPYLKTSKKIERDVKAKSDIVLREKERHQKREEEFLNLPTVTLSATPLALDVPTDISESQSGRLQSKRKYPTCHVTRVRSVILQNSNIQQIHAQEEKRSLLLVKRKKMEDKGNVIEVNKINKELDNLSSPSSAAVLITGDTDGSVIAWKVEMRDNKEGVVERLVYIASANCSGRITHMASLMQE